jgi:hypothetical protein
MLHEASIYENYWKVDRIRRRSRKLVRNAGWGPQYLRRLPMILNRCLPTYGEMYRTAGEVRTDRNFKLPDCGGLTRGYPGTGSVWLPISNMSTFLAIRMRFYYRLEQRNPEFCKPLLLQPACACYMIGMFPNNRRGDPVLKCRISEPGIS